MREALFLVTRAISNVSNSMGAPVHQPYVERILTSPQSADANDFYVIAGMRLGDFYSHSQESLPNDPEEFWHRISSEIPQPHSLGLAGDSRIKRPKPSNTTTIGQIASYLE